MLIFCPPARRLLPTSDQYPSSMKKSTKGELVEVERPPQQLCPVHSRRPLRHQLLPGRCLKRHAPLLRTCWVEREQVELIRRNWEMIRAASPGQDLNLES